MSLLRLLSITVAAIPHATTCSSRLSTNEKFAFRRLWVAEARPTASSAGSQSLRQIVALVLQLRLGSDGPGGMRAKDQHRFRLIGLDGSTTLSSQPIPS